MYESEERKVTSRFLTAAPTQVDWAQLPAPMHQKHEHAMSQCRSAVSLDVIGCRMCPGVRCSM